MELHILIDGLKNNFLEMMNGEKRKKKQHKGEEMKGRLMEVDKRCTRQKVKEFKLLKSEVRRLRMSVIKVESS